MSNPLKILKETVPDVAIISSKEKKEDTCLKVDDLKIAERTWTKEKEDVMRIFVGRFSDLFSIDESDLGRIAFPKHVIETEGSRPIYQSATPKPLFFRPEISRMI